MFERAYRQRLEADLARWQADGVIAPDAGAAIRATLQPIPKGVDIATAVAIVGGLLVAAAFLAFVAANWTAIARPARFAILLAGIASAYGIAIWFDRAGRTILADLAVAVGCIVFGAAIALVGQMYHLSGDFAAGVLLWAGGALAAAVLTGSRGALAVALAAGCVWTYMRSIEQLDVPHLPFVAFWLVAAGLAVGWNAAVARHLAAVAATAWVIITAVALEQRFHVADAPGLVGVGAALLLAVGLVLAASGPEALRALGLTLSTYAALVFAVVIAVVIAIVGTYSGSWRDQSARLTEWFIACGIAGAAFAFVATALGRRPGPAVAGVAVALALIAVAGWTGPGNIEQQPWLRYVLALAAMLCLVVSGMLDDVRPRVVAGWIGLAAVIGAITWTTKGSLLHRSVFLAMAGGVAVAVAIVLGRVMPKEDTR